MFLLLVAVYACIELRELYPKGSDPREALKTWHYMLGLTVFLLVWLRLLARLIQQTPLIHPSPNLWLQRGAKITLLALYILMIGMPIGGWLTLSGEGKNIPFYAWSLPALIADNKDTADFIENIHETVGTVGYYLIGLHALAAIFHHYLIKDNTLRRMLPPDSKKQVD
jgi:cytochrome b561